MNEYLSWSAVVALITFTIQQGVKTWLDIKKSRSEVVFTQLHRERALVIKELYQKMAKLNNLLDEWEKNIAPIIDTTPGPLKSHYTIKCSKIRESLNVAKEYFLSNKIYFSEKLAEQINSALDGMIINDSTCEISHELCRQNKKSRLPFIKNGRIHYPYVYLFSTLLLEIEREFRKLLGSK
ncbi:hypothetical protein [Bacteroides sp.]|uniref:hypothetical protein n=1 Tax=Bacteroides sp. TaxID=29523 RepID=UPI002620077C|nr:hypothetical protein [Bacteroides sp.]